MSRRLMLDAFLLLSFAVPLSAWSQPTVLQNARIQVRSVAPGQLGSEIRRGGAEPGSWLGYAVPAIENIHSGECRSLEESDCADRGTTQAGDLAAVSQLLVFVRVADGKVDRVRWFSDDRRIDAHGRPVTWLSEVKPDESVALLVSLIRGEYGFNASAKRSSHDGLIGAIAMHADPAADRALKELIGKDQPLKVREKAAFWLGNSRGRAGLETLKSIVPRDEDSRFRKNATFAISQSREPEAVATLIEMARHDNDTGVRGQALFWLAHKAERKATQAIGQAIEEDPNTEVKKKAVFALTQLPPDESVPQLIRVATQNKNRQVRKTAIFWLGQSRDPRALDFIERILTQ